MRYTPSILALVTLLACAVLAPGQSSPKEDHFYGRVELLIKAPDGKPVSGARVTVRPRDWHERSAPPSESGTTDASGRMQIDWPAGVKQMNVDVPGIGYGITGLCEVTPTGITRPPLPPLVPWSVIEGTLPPEARGASTKLQMRLRSDSNPTTLPVDQNGRFHAEVRAGEIWLTAKDQKKSLARTPGSLGISPAEHRQEITFVPVPADVASQRAIRQYRPGEKQTVTWVCGTVRDPSGKPVSGATVYATGVFSGSLRMYQRVKQAQTDEKGEYEIKGEGGLGLVSMSVLAHLPGKPLAWAWIQASDQAEWIDADKPAPVRPLPPPPQRDLTLADKGGELDITLLEDGKPVEGASVLVTAEGPDARDVWAMGSGEAAEKEVYNLLHPSAQTDASGVAHFKALSPGLFRIFATRGSENVRRFQEPSLRAVSTNSYGLATEVVVREGRTTAHRLNIYHHSTEAVVEIFRHDGKPVVDPHAPFEYGPINGGGGGWTTGLQLDESGVGRPTFPSEGLWRVALKYRESRITSFPVAPPYFEASGVVAVSRLLTSKKPAGFTAIRVDPAWVDVRLSDRAGKPLEGVVEIAPPAGAPAALGSTNQSGEIRFEGIPNWNYFVRGYPRGTYDLDLGSYEAPVPSVEALQGRTEVIPEPIVTRPNARLQVALRVQPVGYLRATLKAPAGHAPTEFSVWVEGDAGQRARQHYRPSTGEFAAGPLAAGTVSLRVVSARNREELDAREVVIEPLKVSQLELHPRAPRSTIQGGATLLGMGGLSTLPGGIERLQGRVLLADGKTPALGARVFYFGPRDRTPALQGWVDASGRIQTRGVWRLGNQEDTPDESDSPAGPVVVASLPGVAGAAVQRIPTDGPAKSLEIVLPKPISVRGNVTVGGAEPPRQGVIRVVAACRGRGRLNSSLSVSTVAQADGTFELGGLSAGDYEVQATLDDVWFSPAVPLTIGETAPAAPLHLSMAAPGGPLLVQLVDAGGQPVKGHLLSVDRPAGPLTRSLWPAEWTTDGAGQVWLPALESGKRVLTIQGAPGLTRKVAVPALPATAETPVRIEFKGEGK